MIKVRKTTEEDIPDMLEIFSQARRYMHDQGIDQWKDGYPGEADIRKDMEADGSYVVVEDGKVVGSAFLSLTPDEDYSVIRGKWLNDSPYLVIHRIAVSNQVKGKGYAGYLLDKGISIAREHGLNDLRIDTHDDNLSMQAFILKHGFVYCGDITLHRDGSSRRAYLLHL